VRVSIEFPRWRPGETKKNSVHRKVVVRCLGGTFASDEAPPRFVAFMNDFRGVLLVLSLARESELVLGLAIGDLVDTVRGAK
jgi:hypothetical protein